MLDVLRKKKQSFLINGLLVIIIGVFIFWGIGTGIADKVESVATVNGETISRSELDRAADGLMRNFRQMNPNAELPPELIRSQALDQLITSKLFQQEAQKLGLQTTDEELRDSIARLPVFQVEGRFDKEQYLRTLQANRRSPSDFEEAQREQVLSTKLQELITAGAHVSTDALREKFRHDNERVNLRYVRVAADPFKAAVTITDSDLESYYNTNKEMFREPARTRIEFVLFDPRVIGAQLTPTDEEIKARYEANPDDYRRPEEVHARHILFKADNDSSTQEKDAAKAKAADVLKQLEAGADFAEMAKKYSQDGTAAAGGDLGFFRRGQMVPAFEQPAFSLAPGALSQVVESPFGFHIIKVEEKRPEGVDSLAEAQPRIIEAIRSERGREAALQGVEKAHDRLLDGADMNTVASEANQKVETPPPFSASDRVEGLGRQPDMKKVIEQTPSGEVGDIINADLGYAVFRVVERIDSAIPELSTIRPKVEQSFRFDRAKAQAKEKAEALLKRLQESKDLDALAAAESLKVEETGPFGRAGAYVPGLGAQTAMKDNAFTLTTESPIAPAVYLAEGDTGDSVIAALKERIPADETAFATQEKQLSTQARRQIESTLMQEFVNHLKASGKIEIDPSYGGAVGG